MQLGTRWVVGDEPPRRLPAVMIGAIADVESELDGLETTDAAGWRWTLTWLESRPIVELDDGTTLNYDPASETVTRTQLDDN